MHDWDNTHGLDVESGGVVFGDGHLDDGSTRELALAGARAGIDDVEVAYELGTSGSRAGGAALYRKVREVTGAAGTVFVAEERVPRPTSVNPAQNWRAADVESLWASPVVGDSGTTVGEALVAMLEPGGQFIRQVEALGEGLAGSHGVFAVPILGSWLSGKCCQAYHGGFVEPLADDPQQTIWALVDSGQARREPDRVTSGTAGVR